MAIRNASTAGSPARLTLEGVRWFRVVSFGAGATLRMGSQGEVFTFTGNPRGYVAARREEWDQVVLTGTATVEWCDGLEPYPGAA